jgi:hypothetical protein
MGKCLHRKSHFVFTQSGNSLHSMSFIQVNYFFTIYSSTIFYFIILLSETRPTFSLENLKAKLARLLMMAFTSHSNCYFQEEKLVQGHKIRRRERPIIFQGGNQRESKDAQDMSSLFFTLWWLVYVECRPIDKQLPHYYIHPLPAAVSWRTHRTRGPILSPWLGG